MNTSRREGDQVESAIDRFFQILDQTSTWGTLVTGAVAVIWIIMPVVVR